MIKLLLLALLNAMVLVNAELTCHYEALPFNSTDCPDWGDFSAIFDEQYAAEDERRLDYDVDQFAGAVECPLDLSEAADLFNAGTLMCESDAKYFMKGYESEFENYVFGTHWAIPDGNLTETDWDTRPEGTFGDEDNCYFLLDMYHIRCEEVPTAVGGEDCKALDEAGCAAQPDSCHAKTRGGKFRNCKPKRCKPMTEDQCEAAVHCEKKHGRRGNYKRCRRIDSTRASTL